jgi:hypothetical protein
LAIIDLAALKTWLKIKDDNDDARLLVAVNAANAAVVAYCGRTFDKVAVGQETTRTYRPTDRFVLEVEDFYDTTNLVVKTDDSDVGLFATTWNATDFELEPRNGLDGPITVPYWRIRAVGIRRWATHHRRSSVQVTAAWGWSSVPDDVYEAALIKGARLFKRQATPEGVMGGVGDMGVVRVTQREDPDVCILLRPYRRVSSTAMVG